jgi:hypothetical protein
LRKQRILWRASAPNADKRRSLRIKGYYSSGWHLHQSLTEASTGRNLFTPQAAGEILSPLGQAYLAGLLHYAAPATVFATPTVNGYRRFRPNSLAPDRATWAYDHRGAMIRVLGGVNDPATRLENRIGEPAANRISTFFLKSSRDWRGSSANPLCHRPATSPTRPSARYCRRACRKRSMPSIESRCSDIRSATPSSTISSSSSAVRPTGMRGG